MIFTPSMATLFALIPEHNFNQHTVKVPGKLYITGEYAILEPGHSAILIAVDQYLTAQISLSQSPFTGRLSSDLAGMPPLQYQRSSHNKKVLPLENDLEDTTHDAETSRSLLYTWRYVLAAVDVVEQLVQELKRPLQDYELNFVSDLASSDGQKYGFGSSGAVTVATIRAMLNFYGLAAKNPATIFKLAAIALTNAKSNGSFGDVAAITLGSWVYYQSFDRDWLTQQLHLDGSLADLLLVDWPYLLLENIPPVNQLSLLIGWTQSPASTDDLVDYLRQQMNEQNAADYQAFLDKSKASVERMYLAFKDANIVQIQEELANYRHLLLKLSKQFNLTIETPELEQLVELSHAYQFEAKSSGAGGGDCGIAIGHRRQKVRLLVDRWRKTGIIPLDIKVAPLQY